MRLAHQPVEGGSTPTSPLFRKEDWIVKPVPLETTQRLVRAYHYSKGGSNTAAYTHGLFKRKSSVWDEDCQGVAWWLPPTQSAALKLFPQNWQGVLSLSRLVIVPSVPSNACSFLIRHSMRFIDRKIWPCLVSYAEVEWRGHEGTIYLAAGWKEDGWTKPQPVYVKGDRTVSRKAGPKSRTHKQMLELGCEFLGSFCKKRFVHTIVQKEDVL